MFVTVTACGAEFVPTVCDEKVRLVGEKLIPAVAVIPVQVSGTE